MGSKQYLNRRWIGWLLTLALLVMTLPSGATWQCLNGKPCPADCPMLRQSHHGVSARHTFGLAVQSSHCSHCPSAPVAALAPAARQRGVCPMSQCVLQFHPQPTASLADKQHLALPMLALPPPAEIIAVPTEGTALGVPVSLCFYRSHFLPPSSGRAPPAARA